MLINRYAPLKKIILLLFGLFCASHLMASSTELIMPRTLPKPLNVGVTFMLNNITHLDEKEGLFKANIDLILRWHDPTLAYDPRVTGTNEQELTPKESKEKRDTTWTPLIRITNIQSITSDTSTMTISSNGEVRVLQRMEGVFQMQPDLSAFPFDTQYLSFHLDADSNTIKEIEFSQNKKEIDRSGIREGLSLAGWNLEGISFERAIVRNASGSFYPRYNIILTMERIPFSHLFEFAPLLLIMLSPTLITLYSEASFSTRITAWGGALLTLIAVSFALELKYPALGTNSILPQLIGVVLLYQFIMILLCVSLFNSKLSERFKNPYILHEITTVLQWAIPAGFLLLIVSRILLVAFSA